MKNKYDSLYQDKKSYWGKKVSSLCAEVLKFSPLKKGSSLLDIGCGEGRHAVFFAKKGYSVSAFDLSKPGLGKTKEFAKESNVKIKLFVDDVLHFRLDKKYDILFSTGVLHYLSEAVRKEVFENYKLHTKKGGINAFSILVRKPFIKRPPDGEETAHKWISGELLNFYHDWKIEFFEERIFDCMSGGIPHKHAANRIIARKI